MMDRLSIPCANGLSAEERRALYTVLRDDPTLVAQMLSALELESSQGVASWFLKHHLELGGGLQPGEIRRLYGMVGSLIGWEARLHVLQCLPYLPILESSVADLEALLRDCLADGNKFVRAWAYSGLHQLAIGYPEYRTEVSARLQQALETEAPSVRARIRNLLC